MEGMIGMDTRLMIRRVVAFGAVIAVATGAAAQHKHGAGSSKDTYPHIDAELEIKLQPDWNYRSTYRPNRKTEINSEVEALVGLHITKEFSLHGHGKFERVKNNDRDFSFLGGNGAFVEEFYAKYERERFGLQLGKQNLESFGRAWAEHPGIYHKEFAEAYKLSEAVGLSGFFRLIDDVDIGKHKITGAWFFLDNTSLTNSIFSRPVSGGFLTERPRQTHYRDGGPGNTRWPASYLVTLDGGQPDLLPGLTYNLGYAFLKRGTGQVSGRSTNEHRGVASLAYEFEIAKGVTFTPLAEWVRIKNADFDGTDPVTDAPIFGRTDFYTLSGTLKWQGWSAMAGATLRNNKQPSEAGAVTRDKLYFASLEYAFEFGLNIGVGWKQDRQPIAIDPDGRFGRTNTLGAIAYYVFEF